MYDLLQQAAFLFFLRKVDIESREHACNALSFADYNSQGRNRNFRSLQAVEMPIAV
jgi:hypothetical protein